MIANDLMARYALHMSLITASTNRASEKPAAPTIAFQQSNTHTQRKLDLTHNVRVRQYVNAHEELYYQDEQAHTFSLYMRGGYQAHRTDIQAPSGAPGRYCLMPAGSYSAWHVGSEQQFLHLYFDDSYIKRLALENFDTDPRLVELPHLTFAKSEALAALVQHGLLNFDWQDPDNKLILQHNLQTFLLNLLQTVGVKSKNNSALKAGLSPSAKSRVDDYIRSNFHRQIYLQELAQIAALSEYHFARMFKISFAQTPQQYISRVRVESLQQQLKSESGLPLAQLAQENGFSSQSHMGKVFKQYTGMTPGQFLTA